MLMVDGAGADPNEKVGAVVEAVVVVEAAVEFDRGNPRFGVDEVVVVFPRVNAGLIAPLNKLGVDEAVICLAPKSDVVAGTLVGPAVGELNNPGVEVVPKFSPVDVVPEGALPKSELDFADVVVEVPNKDVDPVDAVVLFPERLGVDEAGLVFPNDVILS